MPQDLEPVWRALANPLRREMLDRLREGPLPTGELVLGFPELSRFAVMQHLAVLESAGLVVSHKLGRTRMNCLNIVPIRLISERWISRYEALWADGLIDLKRRIEGTTTKPTPARAARRIAAGARRTAATATPRKARHA